MEKFNRYLKSPIFAGILACVACFMWGTAFATVKRGYYLLNIISNDLASILLFAGFRFTAAGLAVLIYSLLLTKSLPKFRETITLDLIAYALFATTLMYIFYYIGLSNASGVSSSMINSSAAFVTVFLAHFILQNERINWQKILAVLLAFLGLYILHKSKDAGAFAGFTFKGEGMMAISTVLVAFSSIWNKKLLEKYSPFTICYSQLFYGGLILILSGVLCGGRLDWSSSNSSEIIFVFIWLGLISCTAFTIWSLILQFHPASKMDMYRCTIPLFAALSSYILLGEDIFSLTKILAISLIVSALVLVNLKFKKK